MQWLVCFWNLACFPASLRSRRLAAFVPRRCKPVRALHDFGETPKPWWQTIDDKPTIALARRLAGVFTGLPPDVMVLAYPPQIVRAPSCDATVVRIGDLAPLWTCYLGAARQAMAAQAGTGRR